MNEQLISLPFAGMKSTVFVSSTLLRFCIISRVCNSASVFLLMSQDFKMDGAVCSENIAKAKRPDDENSSNGDSTNSKGSIGPSNEKKRSVDERGGRTRDRDHRLHEKKKKKRRYESDSSSSSESRKHAKRSRHRKSSKKHRKKLRKSDEKDAGEKDVRRSAITGKKIQMKIDKTAEDLAQDHARKQLLEFMNSSYK